MGDAETPVERATREAVGEAAFADAVGTLEENTIAVTANQTETHNLGFPVAEAAFLFVQVIATSGTTDVDVSIHEDTTFDKTDMVFKATGVSINDDVPTGGYPQSADGLPYVEASGNAELHVETIENSGNDGNVLLRIRWIGPE